MTTSRFPRRIAVITLDDQDDARRTLDQDDARRTFTSTDTGGKVNTFRVSQIEIMSDGAIYCWAAQITKKGLPFKNGMGLTMGTNLAKYYGQDVADVVAEAVAAHALIDPDTDLALRTAKAETTLAAMGVTRDELRTEANVYTGGRKIAVMRLRQADEVEAHQVAADKLAADVKAAVPVDYTPGPAAAPRVPRALPVIGTPTEGMFRDALKFADAVEASNGTYSNDDGCTRASVVRVNGTWRVTGHPCTSEAAACASCDRMLRMDVEAHELELAYVVGAIIAAYHRSGAYQGLSEQGMADMILSPRMVGDVVHAQWVVGPRGSGFLPASMITSPAEWTVRGVGSNGTLWVQRTADPHSAWAAINPSQYRVPARVLVRQ